MTGENELPPGGDEDRVRGVLEYYEKQTDAEEVAETEAAWRDANERPSRRYNPGMSNLDRITIEPGKRGGKPALRGMRMTVGDVFDYLAGGMSEVELLEEFPELTHEDMLACYEWAARSERGTTFRRT